MVWSILVKFLHRNRVNVFIGSVSDNYLEDRRLPVAILSATKERDGFDFDPGRVDPSSVRVGPGKSRPVDDMSDPEIYTRSLVDLNDDGIPDLVLYFSAILPELTGRRMRSAFALRRGTVKGSLAVTRLSLGTNRR